MAPDARKRDIREVPLAPRHGEIPLFASSALLIEENLDLLMAIRSQRHEEAVHHVCKRLPKTEPEQKKTQTFPDLLSSSIFRAHVGSEKRCFDCAGASGSWI